MSCQKKLNEYWIVPLKSEYRQSMFDELYETIGMPGERWFIFNNNLYIRDDKTYSWIMIKYSYEQ